MSRRLTVSALFVLGFLAVAGFAQPPVNPEVKGPPKKVADPLDDLIGSALISDPDVKVAQAKLQLADAELSKARQAITLKVVGLQASIQEQKRIVALAQTRVDIVARGVAAATVPQSELLDARDKLESAKSQLARLETEMKLLTGGSGRATAPDAWHDLAAVHKNTKWEASCVVCHQAPLGQKKAKDEVEYARSLHLAYEEWLRAHATLSKTPGGPISDRIRAALDKPVKLGAKDAKVTFDQALDVFKKEGGLDVPIRVNAKMSPIVSLGEELPVGAWLQLFADGTPNSRLLVREYGLLVTHTLAEPPEAMTVFDFWKQKTQGPPKMTEPKVEKK